MKIAVFSDSHGSIDGMCSAIKTYKPEMILHLGDGVRDVEEIERLYPQMPVLNVRGNCDFRTVNTPETLVVTIEGVKMFLAHGHRHGVKTDLDAFLNAVYFSGSVLGLYGHTHIPQVRQFEEITLFNPGSCSHYRPTYGQLLVEKGKFHCEIADV